MRTSMPPFATSRRTHGVPVLTRWSRRFVGLLALSLMVAYAYAPLVDIGFVREDFEMLGRTADLVEDGHNPDTAFRIPFTNGHPLAGLSVLASQALWSVDGDWSDASALPLRLENLALLLIAAWGLGIFALHLLRPWTGSERARTASWAVAVLVALHPFHVVGVVTLAARPNLLAAAFGAWAGASFLRGRQERRFSLIVVAGLLALGAALSGGLGLCLPLLLAGAEYASAHRYRPAPTRLRTSINTLLIFAACVAIDPALRSAHARAFRGPSFLTSLAELDGPAVALQVALTAIEKLGLVMLPVNVAGLGLIGYALAGALVLAALHPALIAARSAPRLWGWILFSWTVALLLSLLSDCDVRVHAGDLSETRVLFPTSLVMAVGTAIAATALPGLRSVLLPAAVALGFALLAHANTLPWQSASRELELLIADLRVARERHGGEVALLAVDPGGRTRRVDALGASLPWLVHPTFAGDVPWDEDLARRARGRLEGAGVREIDSQALGAFVREREFALAREAGLVLVVPRSARGARSGRPRTSHRSFAVPRAADPLAPEPEGGIDPFAVRGLVASFSAPEGVGDAEADAGRGGPARPRASWQAELPGPDEADAAREGEASGAWWPSALAIGLGLAAEQGPVGGASATAPLAVFDLHQAPDWFGSRSVRNLTVTAAAASSVAGRVPASHVRLITALPELEPELAPTVVGSDWRFELPASVAPLALAPEVRFRLRLLDLSTFELLEFAAEPGLGDEGAGVWVRIEGAEAAVLRIVRRAGGPVAWTLSATVDDVAVAEAHGRRRRVGRRGSEEAR